MSHKQETFWHYITVLICVLLVDKDSICVCVSSTTTFSVRFEVCKKNSCLTRLTFQRRLQSSHQTASSSLGTIRETTCGLDLCSVCPTFQLHLTSILVFGLNFHDQRNITGKAVCVQCQLLTEWNWQWINMKRHPSMRTSSIVSANCFSSKHYG